ncbi:MAG: leucine-rich repeat domain-containing protein [Lachnospiraceae bacterium]|nr:leucine-rich repeat domain-containing protein [Lachnospiraceae bacterium]
MKKGFLLLLLAILLSIGMKSPFHDNTVYAAEKASGKCGSNAKWSYSNGTLTISGKGAMKNYTSKMNYPWKKYRKKIKGVLIGTNITKIGNYAFYKCSNLTALNFEDVSYKVKEIGNYACSYTGIKAIAIPSTVNKIGKGAFASSKIKTVLFPSDNRTLLLEEKAFYNCKKLQTISFPDRVSSIGKGAFANCTNLKKTYITNRKTLLKYKNIFQNDSKNTIYGYSGSTAETYAKKYKLKFTAINVEESVLLDAYYLAEGGYFILHLDAVTPNVPSGVIGGWNFLVQCSTKKDFSKNLMQAETFLYYSSDDGSYNYMHMDKVWYRNEIKGKTHYVRVRPFRMEQGKRVYGSDWSNVVTISGN